MTPINSGYFRKMYPKLSPWAPGEMDGPAYLDIISDKHTFFFSDLKDASNIPAGYTYLGQFIAHDLSFDQSPTSEILSSGKKKLPNYSTPAFDLGAMYGGGPEFMPFLYDSNQKFHLEVLQARENADCRFYDMPRYQNKALIPDHRNDENLLVSQLHVSFMLFHNAMIDRIPGHLSGKEKFEEARRQTIWHYQFLLVHDYLKRLLCEPVYMRFLQTLNYPTKRVGKAYIPVEFSGAVFRFGHSQIRKTYEFNTFIGDFAELKPGNRLAQLDTFVDWRFFFDKGVDASILPQYNEGNIEGKFMREAYRTSNICIIPGFLISPEFAMTLSGGEGRFPAGNLVKHNLKRGWKYQLPSGQSLARALRCPDIDWNKLAIFFYYNNDPAHPKFPSELSVQEFQENTPLYYYILAEALDKEKGMRLGPVGSNIVAKTVINLLLSDPNSYIRQAPGWEPETQGNFPGFRFTMADFLAMANASGGNIAM